MNINELEKRLEIMCKLAEYNQKIRDDYDKGISAVLDGTQKVIDFITKNTTPPTPQPSSIKSVVEPIVDIVTSSNPSLKLLEKGVSMLFDEPKEPVHPIDAAKIIEPEVDYNEILKTIFQKVGELRKMINESDIGLNEKYMFEKFVYDLQKIIWEAIKNR